VPNPNRGVQATPSSSRVIHQTGIVRPATTIVDIIIVIIIIRLLFDDILR